MRFFRKTYEKETDEDLMIAFGKGDKKAFDEIYERYSRKLFGYFMNMLRRDQEKAEDLVHDLFAKLIRNPMLFDTQRTFRVWVFSVATNMCKNEYKKMDVRKNTVNGVEEMYALATDTNVLLAVQDVQFKEAFESELQCLDEKHREVFMLRHLDGLSIKEISDVIQINEGTVKSRLFYATKHLAGKLKDFNPVLNV
jgi:RNA polymerase sigma-70 factor, ECF subfamily